MSGIASATALFVKKSTGQKVYEGSAEFNKIANENNVDVKNICACSNTKKTVSLKTSEGTVKTEHSESNTATISFGSVDKRVALTCAPKTDARDERKFAYKIFRVLGQEKFRKNWIKTGSYFYGLLHNALSGSSGLIFPYTPKVTFSHQVTWENTEITHSNISYLAYKSTPCPTISLDAKFTADNRDNALHMLSAIWFLTACTKCEFGEKASEPGLPPPVLYLNGYDHLIDNIPVVISSVNYTYPEDKHYVNLILDMSKNYNNDEEFCKVYTTTTTYTDTVSYFPKSYKEIREWGQTGEVIGAMWDLPEIGAPADDPSTATTTRTQQRGIDLSFWLPTSISIGIQLKIQPNLLKVRKQWNLNDYKTGFLTHNKGKNPPVSFGSGVSSELVGVQQISKDVQSACEKTSVVEDKMEFIPSGWTW